MKKLIILNLALFLCFATTDTKTVSVDTSIDSPTATPAKGNLAASRTNTNIPPQQLQGPKKHSPSPILTALEKNAEETEAFKNHVLSEHWKTLTEAQKISILNTYNTNLQIRHDAILNPRLSSAMQETLIRAGMILLGIAIGNPKVSGRVLDAVRVLIK